MTVKKWSNQTVPTGSGDLHQSCWVHVYARTSVRVSQSVFRWSEGHRLTHFSLMHRTRIIPGLVKNELVIEHESLFKLSTQFLALGVPTVCTCTVCRYSKYECLLLACFHLLGYCCMKYG